MVPQITQPRLDRPACWTLSHHTSAVEIEETVSVAALQLSRHHRTAADPEVGGRRPSGDHRGPARLRYDDRATDRAAAARTVAARRALLRGRHAVQFTVFLVRRHDVRQPSDPRLGSTVRRTDGRWRKVAAHRPRRAIPLAAPGPRSRRRPSSTGCQFVHLFVPLAVQLANRRVVR